MAFDTSFEFVPGVYDAKEDELTYDISVRLVAAEGDSQGEWKSIEFIEWL